ncbi:hypothetical protein [Leptospira weilii]|uniref:hypothetical protein n=3 Tax=Leptospira weilii TaxID=28184 RepID=UPI0012F96390|nr:hypothetical protein [Leptospira weilii]
MPDATVFVKTLTLDKISKEPSKRQNLWEFPHFCETKASRFYWREKKLSVSLLLAREETQRLASIGARRNSASRFYWREKKLSVSLLLAREETQRLASIGARRNSASRFYWRETGLFNQKRISDKWCNDFLIDDPNSISFPFRMPLSYVSCVKPSRYFFLHKTILS